MLQLDWSKAAQQLRWRPQFGLEEALSMTIEWYQHFLSGNSAREKCAEQISAYCGKVGREIAETSLSPSRMRKNSAAAVSPLAYSVWTLAGKQLNSK